MIPAHNEEECIQDVIDSVLKCPYVNKEIIVIDDGSTDNTSEIIKKYSLRGLVKHVRHEKPSGTKPIALNLAFSHVSGEIIAIIDADCILDKNALDNIPKYFHNKNVIAASGHVKIKSGDKNTYNTITRLQKYEYAQSIELGKKFGTVFNTMLGMSGAFLIIRKNALEKVGLFSTDVRAEDLDITLKLRKLAGRILFAEDVIVHTYCPNSLKSLAKQRLYWSKGETEAAIRHKSIICDPRCLLRSRLSFVNFVVRDMFLGYFSIACFSIILLSASEKIIPSLVLLALYVVMQYVVFSYTVFHSKSTRNKSDVLIPFLFLFFYNPLNRLIRLVGFAKTISKKFLSR